MAPTGRLTCLGSNTFGKLTFNDNKIADNVSRQRDWGGVTGHPISFLFHCNIFLCHCQYFVEVILINISDYRVFKTLNAKKAKIMNIIIWC